MRVVRAKTGEQTGDDAAQCEKREIRENTCAADDQVSCCELSCVVSQRPQNAGQWEKASVKKAVCSTHHKKTEQAAHGTVNESHHLPGEEGGQKDSCKQYRKGVGGAVIAKYDQGHNVGKSKLDPRNGDRHGNHIFYCKDSQCNNGKHG